jgi:arginyl-tRNA synthetase
VITRDVRRAVDRAVAAAGFRPGTDPGLRPTGTPGQYAASVALTLGANPRGTAATLAAALTGEQWIAAAEVTGPGYLVITVTPEALAAVADDVTAAGSACVTSSALAGLTVPAASADDPLAAANWEEARAALAARLTARLAAAAGATVADLRPEERERLTLPAHPSSPTGPEPPVGGASRRVANRDSGAGAGPHRCGDQKTVPDAKPRSRETDVARAVAFAGRDEVTFTLARAIPGQPVQVDPRIIARRVPGNPAYAVRYAHARAASGVRWAAVSAGEKTASPATAVAADGSDTVANFAIGPGSRDSGGSGGASPREKLLDALSWLPERVAIAARRGRPDEFARYLEDLASVTVDVLSSASHPGNATRGDGRAPGTDRLTLARAARTGLAAGLGLLGVSAPERL